MKYTSVIALALLLSAAVVTNAADAKANWDKQCAKCHGPAGKGDTKMGKKLNVKSLVDAKVQESFTDEKAFSAIKNGVKEGTKTLMKPAESLSDAEIQALVAYVRSLKK